MPTGSNPFDGINPDAYRAYVFWSSVLLMKLFLMLPLTAINRFRKQAFANPEDTAAFSRKAKPKFDDPDVERVRRAHRNDLENILPFFVVGFLYLLTNPAPAFAINMYRLVAVSRILHTVVYAVVPLPQPARFLAFVGALAPTVYMTLQTLLYFL
ncbi:microsomal glutathione S-transferase 1-like [Anopheles aquasalis]|nr:microsomal glutathione S-transferase 1-like [Anopheles aquasalis]